jgi:hypothetical protein
MTTILEQNNPLYEVNIDFDESIREWRSNKKKVGEQFVYICGEVLKNGKLCQRKPSKNDSNMMRCFHHKK